MTDIKFSCWFILVAFLVLAGCASQPNVTQTRGQETGESKVPSEMASSDKPKPAYLEPPDLLVIIDGERLQPARGSYSWSADTGNGIMKSTEADSFTPPQLVENHTPREVAPRSEIELIFETMPVSYEIIIWDENGNIKSTADQFYLSKQQGEVIYEVVAEWTEGEVSYAFTVNVGHQ